MPLACPCFPVVMGAQTVSKVVHCGKRAAGLEASRHVAACVHHRCDAEQGEHYDSGRVCRVAALSAPTFIANFIRSEAAAAAAAGRHAAEIGTMTDASVVDMGTQATADDAVDTATAEAMIAEALRMVDEANERERLAEERARSWQGYAELGRSLLQAAEDRTDRAQAEREVAERSAAAERAAKQMAEQLLAAEAALADAAETRADR